MAQNAPNLRFQPTPRCALGADETPAVMHKKREGQMIDFAEMPYTDDTWELFARDFLRERGFFIESPPDRGPDAGKDLLIIEQLKGNLNKYQFRWLVSCKHFASSGASVTEKDEPNILERVSA